ncbi:hypothetical protein GCK32_019158, partial [Trichostrongylus colubriformis]
MVGAITFLVLIAVSMCAFHIWHQRKKNPEEEAVRMQALSVRSRMLADAALHVDQPEVQTTLTKKERRRSLTNPFRTRRSTSVGMNLLAYLLPITSFIQTFSYSLKRAQKCRNAKN